MDEELDFDGAVSQVESALEAIDQGDLSEAAEHLLEGVRMVPEDWEGRSLFWAALVSCDFGERGDAHDECEQLLSQLHDADMD